LQLAPQVVIDPEAREFYEEAAAAAASLAVCIDVFAVATEVHAALKYFVTFPMQTVLHPCSSFPCKLFCILVPVLHLE